jgi:hypothetical protein
MKEKGYGYATMKVDACISMGFFWQQRFTAKTKSSSTFSK